MAGEGCQRAWERPGIGNSALPVFSWASRCCSASAPRTGTISSTGLSSPTTTNRPPVSRMKTCAELSVRSPVNVNQYAGKSRKTAIFLLSACHVCSEPFCPAAYRIVSSSNTLGLMVHRSTCAHSLTRFMCSKSCHPISICNHIMSAHRTHIFSSSVTVTISPRKIAIMSQVLLLCTYVPIWSSHVAFRRLYTVIQVDAED